MFQSWVFGVTAWNNGLFTPDVLLYISPQASAVSTKNTQRHTGRGQSAQSSSDNSNQYSSLKVTRRCDGQIHAVSQLHKGTATLAECKGTSQSQHVISIIFSFFSLKFLQYFLRSGSQPNERGLAHEWRCDREGACDRVAMCQHLLLCRSRVFSTHLKNRPGRGWSAGVTLQELTALSWRSR